MRGAIDDDAPSVPVAPRGALGRALALTVTSALVALACATTPAPRVRTAPPAAAPSFNDAEGAPPAPRADAGERPEPAPPAAPRPRAVTIGASGDILCHIKVVRSAREQPAGWDHVFGRLRAIIGEDEVALANLETPLSERIPPETGEPPVLGAPGDVAEGLRNAGIDAVSVANNHSYDQTAAGLGDTLAALAAAGVGAAGAAATLDEAPGPVLLERDGVRVAFLAFTERVNRGAAGAEGGRVWVARYDDALARAALARARAQADVVVVSIHWSHDYIQRPLAPQRSRARLLVDAGADVIIGHGPHVLQEVERLESPRGEAVVAYSLGNLVSNQGLRYFVGRRIPRDLHPAVVLPTVRDGAWLRTRVALDDDGRVRIERLEAVPLWTHNNYVDVASRRAALLDVHVGPLTDADEATRAERRPAIAAALGSAVTLLDE
ncbi:MAG: CapA family protein [Sandaracinaceae bacterium]|nr:CapA family protein [Sandaracinaceae bacterium]